MEADKTKTSSVPALKRRQTIELDRRRAEKLLDSVQAALNKEEEGRPVTREQRIDLLLSFRNLLKDGLADDDD